MRIGIIGAGISGLAAAQALAGRGHEIAVFERDTELGGLIGTFDLDGTRVERYYHFLCGEDQGYFDLCRDLGLSDRIRFRRARTGFFYEGREFGFTSPLDLLRFTPIPLTQRLRFGAFALEARMRTEWRQLDEITARPWLMDRIGQRAYDVIWHPLLALKFGVLSDTISAAWVWHRLHRVARSKGRMGYLHGGTAILLDTLTQSLTQQGVALWTGRPVTRLHASNGHVHSLELADGDVYECDHVISTVPVSVLSYLLPDGWDEYASELQRIQYVGVVCVIFKLASNVTHNFWLNINDSTISSNGIIEYTNLNPMERKDGHIVYVPYYMPTDHPLYLASDDEVVQRSWEALPQIAPGLNQRDVIAHRVFRSPYAQAVCATNFLRLIPSCEAPIRGLHLLDSVFLYPEDRTQSGLILKARECAARILKQTR